jgi:hypothetical protein
VEGAGTAPYYEHARYEHARPGRRGAVSSLAHGDLLAFFDAVKYDRTMRFAVTFATALLLPAIAFAHGVADPPTPFAQARKGFRTKLTTRAPAPQESAPLGPVAGTERIH